MPGSSLLRRHLSRRRAALATQQAAPQVAVARDMRRWRAPLTLLLTVALLLPTLASALPIAQAETSADPDAEIVYLDNTGTIRILDTLQTSGNPQLDWASPSAGWSSFALGDVNNDGDMEVVAIKTTGTTGELTVWDPVVASGAFDAQTPRGIPWATLYTTTIPGIPKLVATGKLDPNLPGAHILYTYDLGTGSRVIALKPAIPAPNGRQWTVHYTRDFPERWEKITVGNIDNEGADELVFIDDSVGRLSVYRSDANSDALLKVTGESRPWRAATIADYDSGSTKEVIGIRDAPSPLASFFVFKYDKDTKKFNEEKTEAFQPAPRFVFGADINNNNKEAIVMLRSVSTGNTVRMIVRAKDNTPAELEQFLDSDNGYLTGVGGDVDGDGKDEIILMRDNNIRVYTQPERNATRTDYPTLTNTASRVIRTGDLDKNGFTLGAQLSTNISSIDEQLQIGTTGNSKTFELRNATNNDPISYRVDVENTPSWLTLSPRFGNTPALIAYTANAVGLTPGDYTSRIVITSDNPSVINQPYYITVRLKVTPAAIEPRPDAVGFSYLSAQQPATMTRNISIFGTDGIRFTAGTAAVPAVSAAAATLAGAVQSAHIDEAGNLVLQDAEGNEATVGPLSTDAVPWLSINPAAGTIPAVLTLTVDTSQQASDFEQAYVIIIGDPRTGEAPENVRLLPVSLLRANVQLFMPLIRR